MPKPLAMTKQSAPDHSALIELFQRLGHESLESAITAQVGGEFYQSLLKQVEENRQIPEFKGISKSKVTATLESLIAKCNAAQIDAWNLPPKAASLLHVTVERYQLKSESIPCYDVLYETNDGKRAVKIRIATCRRSLEVTLKGPTERLEELSGRLVLSMLRG